MILKFTVECRLVNFEGETVLEECVLTYIEPCAVRAGLALFAVVDDPLVVVLILGVVDALDVALDLREQLVADVDVAVGRPPDRDLALPVLHLGLAELEFFRRTRDAEVFQPQRVVRLPELLRVLRLHLHKNVDVADVDQHVWLEDRLARVHLLEHAEAYLKVADEILFIEVIVPYLEMSAVMLFALGLIPKWNNKIVDHYFFLAGGIVHHRLSIVGLFVIDVGS